MRRSWTTFYRCQSCGERYAHVELSAEDDEPYGLPVLLRWCECGGFLGADVDGQNTVPVG